jgi:hypothetical protein
MTEKRLVDQIAETVEERSRVYGHPHDNLNDIAILWTVIFEKKLAVDATFSPVDVAQAMRLVKECRLKTTPNHRDSLKDIIGYVDVAESCLEFMGK